MMILGLYKHQTNFFVFVDHTPLFLVAKSIFVQAECIEAASFSKRRRALVSMQLP
jgi:hypothetical protein